LKPYLHRISLILPAQLNFLFNFLPVNYMYKPLICKYRIHAHSLKIETGRYLNTDRQERICDFCNDSCIEDEFHLILKCKKYDDMPKKQQHLERSIYH
jgi:hypothetical protein